MRASTCTVIPCLAYFTQHHFFQFHPSCCNDRSSLFNPVYQRVYLFFLYSFLIHLPVGYLVCFPILAIVNSAIMTTGVCRWLSELQISLWNAHFTSFGYVTSRTDIQKYMGVHPAMHISKGIRVNTRSAYSGRHMGVHPAVYIPECIRVNTRSVYSWMHMGVCPVVHILEGILRYT